ncbi:MAG: efflux RND transporter periplasmic adaptor subunit [Hyphomicrobiales bacterium]
MDFKIFRLFVVAMLAMLLAACGAEEEVAVDPTARPVKTVLVGGNDASGAREFPARILASRRVDLAFRVSGTLKDLPVREGDNATQGQTIAELDPKDFQNVVADRQAVFDEAAKNYERGKDLVGKGVLSRVAFDRLEAAFKTAKTALDQAKTDLSYTVLKAPFAGSVARRFVQNFEEVQAKQPIIALSDTSKLDVKFDVPERLMILLTESEDANQADPDLFATFEADPEKKFPLTFKEVATRADSATQTFEVTYQMGSPAELQVLPGMTATVTVDVSAFVGAEEMHLVPVDAIVGDVKLQPSVWIVDKDTMTVKTRPVGVGMLRAGLVEIKDGLETGERVVTAGAPFLSDGMKVWIMPDKEQAAEREEDRELRQEAEKSK